MRAPRFYSYPRGREMFSVKAKPASCTAVQLLQHPPRAPTLRGIVFFRVEFRFDHPRFFFETYSAEWAAARACAKVFAAGRKSWRRPIGMRQLRSGTAP